MFLSKFPVNMARRGAKRLLGSPQAMHAAVLSSFPPGDTSQSERVLWRIESRGQPGIDLLVLSPHQPDFTHLVEQAGWPASPSEPWQVRDYEPLLGRIANGQRWQFRLRANPVKAAKDIGKRVPLVRVEEQALWLTKRAARLGFAVAVINGAAQLEVADRQTLKFRRGDSLVTLSTVLFDGLLDVQDESAFRTTLLSGVGRAKGYGCGLLTVMRPG